VRRSQESLEMAVKSLLRALAIEYPRSHDMGPVLLSVADKLPEGLRKNVESLSSLVSELAAIRGPAMYGYEGEGIPASKVVTESYAREVYERVSSYVSNIAGHLIPILREKGFWVDNSS